jgi:hypothetical protein
MNNTKISSLVRRNNNEAENLKTQKKKQLSNEFPNIICILAIFQLYRSGDKMKKNEKNPLLTVPKSNQIS